MINRTIQQQINSKLSNLLYFLFFYYRDKWIEWSEKKLAIMLYPNITRNFSESWECFDYTSSVSEWDPLSRVANRLLGPVAMSFANGKIKKKYGIVNEREELAAVCQEWVSALGDRPFLHGESPTMPGQQLGLSCLPSS